MQQEINLYLWLPRKKTSFLTLELMALCYGIFILILALNFCFELWGEHKELLTAKALNLELNKTQQSLAAIHDQYPMLDPKDMENSLKKMQQELVDKNSIYDLLSRDRNFSTYLVGVAKAAVPDLWLEDIQAVMNDKGIILKGYATQPKAIQQFVSNLPAQKEFSGLNFQLQQVTKTELNKESLLSFIISTKVSNENET